jgi:hypothetical protein
LKIDSPINFHALESSDASLLVEASTPLIFLEDALGHSDTRMVAKQDAHLAQSYIHDSIRANLPTFGVVEKPELPPGSASASPRIVFDHTFVGRIRTS